MLLGCMAAVATSVAATVEVGAMEPSLVEFEDFVPVVVNNRTKYFSAARNITVTPNIVALIQYADATWNCDGHSPPCPGCKTVASGSSQKPYGCAPYVSHCLNAGGFLPKQESVCNSLESMAYGGHTYNLMVVAKEDPNCGGSYCLMDLLKAMGWTKASKVVAGTVVAVVGEDSNGPCDYCHIVIGVGNGIVNAHNMAHKHVSISNYTPNLMLNPPGMHEEDM